MYKSIAILILLNYSLCAYGQSDTTSIHVKENGNNKITNWIAPAVFTGYGVMCLTNPTLQKINIDTRTELREHFTTKTHIDDYLQYSPLVGVYALNAMRIKGKNNLLDRSIICVTAYTIMTGSVNILKTATKELRPDGSSKNSFPSGHTATAFVGAEILYQEYKHKSPWYGIAGYTIATSVAVLRVYNERHWVGDVVAGAGIGILSTKIAYLVQPWIKKTFFKKKSTISASINPIYNQNQKGIGLSLVF